MRRRAVAVVVGAVLVAAGCAGTEQVVSAAAAPTDLPSHLLGTWSVSGAGVPTGTRVAFSAVAMDVLMPCGTLDGSWDARPGGAFLADVHAADPACREARSTLTLPWLDRAVSFRSVGKGRELLDVQGGRVARLRRWTPVVPGQPGPAQPVSLAARQAADTRPATLPAGLEPVGATDLVGAWAGEPGGAAVLQVDGEGTYRRVSGCWRGDGRWALSGPALLLAGAGWTWDSCAADRPVLVGRAGDTVVLVRADGSTDDLHRVGPARAHAGS